VHQQEIFLTYIAPCHYNAIRRRTSSLPRIFALSRSKSSVEAAMRQAERQGLPQDQVRVRLLDPHIQARMIASRHASGHMKKTKTTSSGTTACSSGLLTRHRAASHGAKD
jgi:hypothetical protein